MRVVVFDCETTGKNKGAEEIIPEFSAIPWHPNNRMVSLGALRCELNGQFQHRIGEYTEIVEPEATGADLEWLSDCDLLVGQNIRFDLWYSRKTWGSDFERALQGMRIWDTALVQYFLDGCVPKPVLDGFGKQVLDSEGCPIRPLSLQALSLRYGGEGKEDEISSMLKAGACCGDLIETHREKLLYYMKKDVQETTRVFLHQVKQAKALGMLPFLMQQMEGLLATYSMGWNGACFNKAGAEQQASVLKASEIDLLETLEQLYRERIGDTPVTTLTSDELLSKVLFGGVIKYKTPMPILDEEGEPVLLKSGPNKGEIKTKLQEVEFKVKRLCKPDKKWKTKKEGIYQVNKEVLAELLDREIPEIARDIIRVVEKLRWASKLGTTYFTGYSDLTWPADNVPEGCGFIRSSLNHNVTATGRLSSSKPNLQNLSKKNVEDEGIEGIKYSFVSRWGDDGEIIEVDYSQLEVVIAAAMSRDSNMINDLLSGVSMHCMSAHFLSGRPYEELLELYNRYSANKEAGRPVTPEESEAASLRQTGKGLSFELQYGAGAASMAEKHKLHINATKTFIENYYARYCGLACWQECVAQEVEATASFEGDYHQGVAVRRGYWRAPTGQRFAFTEEPSGRRDTPFTFKPTKIKNRPVQGTACTAVVLPTLGRMYRALQADPEMRDKCLMIMMVHDSCIFDCHKSVLDKALKLIQTIFEEAPKHIQEKLGVWFGLPLKVEIGHGKTWGHAA